MTSLTRPLALALALLLSATLLVPSHAQEPVGELPEAESGTAAEDGEADGNEAGDETGGDGNASGENGSEGEKADESAAVRPSDAPFMKPLGRLSTILGSVHFLRTLCGDKQADVWRQKMNELIAAQKPNEADRRILVASFNNGYRAFESTYRECTPAADVAARRYLEEGAALSREISARYGS